MNFFEELKRRNVFRVGIAYAVAAWLLLQLTEVLSELLNLPVARGFNDTEFTLVLNELILPAVQDFHPQAIYLQCGADALLEDPLARLALSNRSHVAAVRALRPLAPEQLAAGLGPPVRDGEVGVADHAHQARLRGVDVAAIADAHSLEAAGAKILAPLSDGRLATPENPYAGLVALDGNLTLDLLSEIAHSPVFGAADLRIAPASPGKAERLLPFIQSGRGMLYVNLEEARILGQTDFKSSRDAAAGLLAKGAARVMVTDGGSDASEGRPDGILTLTPPQVLVTRVTGAGDTFMAAHIAADMQNKPAKAALSDALHAAATYVSGETPL